MFKVGLHVRCFEVGDDGCSLAGYVGVPSGLDGTCTVPGGLNVGNLELPFVKI